MNEKKVTKSSKQPKPEAVVKQNIMEWPSFLDEQIMDVIKNDFKFESMTPVQSVDVPIFAQV